jgi:hypothetical protein
VLRSDGERCGEDYRPRASEECASIHHAMSPDGF